MAFWNCNAKVVIRYYFDSLEGGNEDKIYLFSEHASAKDTLSASLRLLFSRPSILWFTSLHCCSKSLEFDVGMFSGGLEVINGSLVRVLYESSLLMEASWHFSSRVYSKFQHFTILIVYIFILCFSSVVAFKMYFMFALSLYLY